MLIFDSQIFKNKAMKKLLILILCYMVGGVKTQAQLPCEFDSVYSYKKNEAGLQILECKTGGFMVFQLNDFASSIKIPNPNILLTKTDNCGNRLWTQSLDSTKCSGTGGTCVRLLNIFEVENGNIECAGYISDNLEKSGTWIYKTDSNGFIQNKVKLDLDSNLYYNMNNFIKINANRYLFTGSNGFVTNKQIAFAVMIDATGKVISNKRYYQDSTLHSSLYKSYLMNSNELMLLGYEDSVLTIIKTDSMLNVTSFQKVSFPNSPLAILDYDSSSIYTICTKNNGLSYIISKLSLDGELIKNRELPLKLNCGSVDIEATTISILSPLPGNRLSLNLCNLILILDSGLNTLKKDSFAYSIMHTTITRDSSIASTGYTATATPTSLFVRFALNKTNILNFVKSISIVGQGTINYPKGSLQLNAIISPTNASNKKVTWRISDSSKATITQTGLLTAKANGTVTVTTQTTDGSNLSASKIIIITNQGVGLTEDDFWAKQIVIYPNPTLSHITIQHKDLIIEHVQLLAINGKVLLDYTNETDYDISSFSNGYYLLKIETDKGIVFKKLMITK